MDDPRPREAPSFRPVPGWGASLPDLMNQDVSDIAADSDGFVYLLYRDPSFVLAAAPDGSEVRRIGFGILGRRAHGVCPAGGGHVYVVDEGEHCIRRFDPSGRQVSVFGSGPTNPSFRRPVSGDFVAHIDKAYPPFSRPTRLSVASSGTLFISDGYGNSCVHAFDEDGKLLRSWGSPGTAPGQFNIPHEVLVDRESRVLVCDRENDRVQVFSESGEFHDEWTDLQRPQGIVEGPGGWFYVAEGAWRPGHVSQRLGPVPPSRSRVSVVDRNGVVAARIGEEPSEDHTGFLAAHGIAMDAAGDLYVAEVAVSVQAKNPGVGGVRGPSVHKFVRAPL